MTDSELTAIWLYLKGVPAQADRKQIGGRVFRPGARMDLTKFVEHHGGISVIRGGEKGSILERD